MTDLAGVEVRRVVFGQNFSLGHLFVEARGLPFLKRVGDDNKTLLDVGKSYAVSYGDLHAVKVTSLLRNREEEVTTFAELRSSDAG